jgi:hypothetical protein
MTWHVHAEVAVDDMAIIDWQMWMNHVVTRGIILVKWFGATWPRHGLPRGTLFFGWLFKILWSPWGSNPGPPHNVKSFGKVRPTNAPHLCLVIYMILYIFKFEFIMVWARVRAGA